MSSEWPPKIPAPPSRPRLRLGQARRKLIEDQRAFTALTLTVSNSMLLLLLAELNYRFLMVYGVPVVSFSGYPDGAGLTSYYSIPGLAWNVPEFFLALTAVAIAILLPAAWQFTKGVRGRSRMLGLLAICSGLSLGFSWCAVRWERVHLEYAEWGLGYLESKVKVEHPDDWRWFNAQRLRKRLDSYRQDRGR
jgi:hypothetical protein